MHDQEIAAPDSTAVRVALWRALHIQIDPAPHIFNDIIGLQLAAPDDGWQRRPDMAPHATSRFRASIVARARFIEDLIIELSGKGIIQYVILGAGLDTFALRMPKIASKLRIFEVDRPGSQTWKKQRLKELGYDIPEWLKFVPAEFEKNMVWWERLMDAGFEANLPALIASSGVSMYLTKNSNMATMRQITSLAPGTTFVETFLLPIELAEPEERPGYEAAIKGAQANGTPFISFFSPQEILRLAQEAGFSNAQHVSEGILFQRYFSGRTDNFRPGSENLLVAIV